jgi:hypothetical protein
MPWQVKEVEKENRKNNEKQSKQRSQSLPGNRQRCTLRSHRQTLIRQIVDPLGKSFWSG